LLCFALVCLFCFALLCFALLCLFVCLFDWVFIRIKFSNYCAWLNHSLWKSFLSIMVVGWQWL
jgi:hypothetical protein